LTVQVQGYGGLSSFSAIFCSEVNDLNLSKHTPLVRKSIVSVKSKNKRKGKVRDFNIPTGRLGQCSRFVDS
jgi:hypothetical protein